MTTEYKIETHYELNELEKNINECLELGWKPHGNLFFEHCQWVQALVRHNRITDKAYRPGDLCPDCGEKLKYNPGYPGSNDDPGELPALVCYSCGNEIEYDKIDWEYIHKCQDGLQSIWVFECDKCENIKCKIKKKNGCNPTHCTHGLSPEWAEVMVKRS